jgi:uncharacterized tellurite resistance protein B-like protein
MGHSWYCQVDGRDIGPISAQELRKLAATAQLRPTDLVRRDPTANWSAASRVKGLFDTPPQTSSPASGAPRRWLFRDGERSLGPYTDQQILQAARHGKLRPEHELRRTDQLGWIKAGSIPRLFDKKPIGESVAKAQVRFKCASCHRTLKCPVNQAGKTFPCPACRASVTVPMLQASPPTVTAANAYEVAPKVVKVKACEEPIELQSAPDTIRTVAKVGAETMRGIVGWLTTPAQPDYRPPKDTIRFYSRGSSVDLGRGVLESSLVYATGQRYRYVQEASLIELPLPVGGSDPAALPYWPTYHDCSAAQRARYLEWLYGGRRDPTVEIGYVFLFFYGLERRVLVDGEDHELVIEELLRLLSIYTSSRSFGTYATSLLWLTIYLGAARGTVTESSVLGAAAMNIHWSEQSLQYCLGYYLRRGKALPAELAWMIAAQDERSPVTIVVRRQPEKLRELFAARFARQYPTGFSLQGGQRETKLLYRPGSSTLLGCHNQPPELANCRIPDLSASRRQFLPLVSLWTDCINELRDFDKANRNSVGQGLSSEAYEALPQELRTEEHPEQDVWQTLLQRSTDDTGWPIVPISSLAGIKKIPARPRLTKRQCEMILATADSLGMALEPDMRLTGKSYEWDEPVVLFHVDASSASPNELTAYRAASVLLRLGYVIAESDGSVEEAELAHVAEHLEQQFDLSPSLSKRLDALRHLLSTQGCGDDNIGRTLQKTLSLDQRRLVGKFLVGVAAADKLISPDEKKSLRKAYKSVGIPVEELEELLAPFDASADSAEDGGQIATEEVVNNEAHPALNFELIAAMRKETERVRDLLATVFDSAEDEMPAGSGELAMQPSMDADGPCVALAIEPQGKTLPTDVESSTDDSTNRNESLPHQYRMFFQAVITRPRWPRQELESVAREQRLMFEAAVSAINEWSTDNFNDWLIEDSDTDIIVHTQILEGN